MPFFRISSSLAAQPENHPSGLQNLDSANPFLIRFPTFRNLLPFFSLADTRIP